MREELLQICDGVSALSRIQSHMSCHRFAAVCNILVDYIFNKVRILSLLN